MNTTNHKQRYSKEFKDSSVQLALNGSASITQTAKDLGLRTILSIIGYLSIEKLTTSNPMPL